MAEVTKVDEAEIDRRESYVRENNRPRVPIDPFTHTYPFKAAYAAIGLAAYGAYQHNRFFRKPWNHQLIPRLFIFAAIGFCGYGLGAIREHHYKTRDAILEHYQQLHSDEFLNVNDSELIFY